MAAFDDVRYSELSEQLLLADRAEKAATADFDAFIRDKGTDKTKFNALLNAADDAGKHRKQAAQDLQAFLVTYQPLKSPH